MTAGGVLVTGAAGFIGSAVCRDLMLGGYEVHGTVRPQSPAPDGRHRRWRDPPKLHQIELADAAATRRLVASLEPRAIVHTAVHNGRNYGDPLPAIVADDVLATANVIHAAGAAGSRLVHFDSPLVAGERSEPLPDEVDPTPATLRGVTKSAASQLVRLAVRQGRIRALTVRPFHVYGPCEPGDRLVTTLLRAALAGDPVRLTHAQPRRDFTFVDDVAAATRKAIESPIEDGRTFNIGSGVGRTSREVLEAVERITETQLEVDDRPFPARCHDHEQLIARTTGAAEALGWNATTRLDEGLRRTLEWMHSIEETGP